jgi:hypothetical protein
VALSDAPRHPVELRARRIPGARGPASGGQGILGRVAELESTVVRLCLVATRGITEDLLERLAHELRRDLPALLPTVTWRISTQPDLEIGPPVPLGELVDRARSELLARRCHLLVLLTDLPLMIGRKPVLSHVTRAQGVAVLSFPAHGAVAPHNRAVKTLRAAVAALIGVGPVGELSRGGRRRATARMRELGRRVANDQGAVAFVARVITGNFLLLAGMIRANQPWRLALHLSKALTAALTAGVFALVTTDIWRLADVLGTPRLVMITVGSVTAIGATLIIGADLWERGRRPEARQQVLLFNLATTATVVLGVTAFYAMLIVLTAMGALILVPTGFLSNVLGHSAQWGDRAELAWLAGSVATLGGALGAGLESDDAVRQAAYAYAYRQPPS